MLSRRTKILLVAAVAVIVVLLLGVRLVGTYVDWLWFGEVGFRGVFDTVLLTRFVQFIIGGLLIGGVLALNLVVAYRTRPVFLPASRTEDPVGRYRAIVSARLRLFGIGLPLVVALIAGLAAQGDWQTTQLFLHATPFGIADPEFGKDVSFYAFQLPFYREILDWLFVTVTISFFGALISQYVFGGIRLAGRSGQLSGPARAQLAVLAGTFVLLKAFAYFLDRYELMFSGRKAGMSGADFYGASYTDLNAVLPAKLILLAISVICAAAFFAAVFLRNLQVPAIATALLVLSSILVGAAWPAVLEQFSVKPNANNREAIPIQRNIAATRQAFGLTNVDYIPYAGRTDLSPAEVQTEVQQDQATIPNIRLLDPSKLSKTFTQLEQLKNFYGFPDQLDIDRYTIGGVTRDYVVAAREIDPKNLTGNQTDWINQHLVYTHGNGFVAAPANTVNSSLDASGGLGGYPVFQVSDVSTQGAIKVTQPRIYYGPLISDTPDDYAIVRTNQGEYDTDRTRFTYNGSGGVPLGGWFNRLAFAVAYGERNILFNGQIGPNSKILYNRNPRERVQKVAPWLTLDSDPYPAVVDGRIVWIIDGYTTLDNYPYAQQEPLGDVTRDTLGSSRQPNKTISYIRNSVKATVDAYDGTVTLYAVDENDPVLKTWMKAFPGVVKPASAISPDLRAHFRYPEDLFKVQRELLTRYHVSNPQEFFSTVSFWDVPSDPTVDSGPDGQSSAPQPPYYVLAGDPRDLSDPTAEFQLTSAVVSLRREFLSAYISVSSDPRTYGRITVLKLPGDTQTRGPQQVQTQFLSSSQVSTELNLLRQQSTQVFYGNLLTLPVAGGLLYVEPVYIERSNQDSSFPQLLKVLVSFGGRVGYASTLNDALDQVFGSGAGQSTTQPGEQPPAPAPPPPPSPSPAGTQVSAQLAQAVQDISTALQEIRAAQQSGNFQALGKAYQDLDDATKRFEAAKNASGAASSTPTPAPSTATPTPAPSTATPTPAPSTATPPPAASPGSAGGG